jgi:hypothetical protein
MGGENLLLFPSHRPQRQEAENCFGDAEVQQCCRIETFPRHGNRVSVRTVALNSGSPGEAQKLQEFSQRQKAYHEWNLRRRSELLIGRDVLAFTIILGVINFTQRELLHRVRSRIDVDIIGDVGGGRGTGGGKYSSLHEQKAAFPRLIARWAQFENPNELSLLDQVIEQKWRKVMNRLCAALLTSLSMLTSLGIVSAQAYTCEDVRSLTLEQRAYYIKVFNITSAQQERIRHACYGSRFRHAATSGEARTRLWHRDWNVRADE